MSATTICGKCGRGQDDCNGAHLGYIDGRFCNFNPLELVRPCPLCDRDDCARFGPKQWHDEGNERLDHWGRPDCDGERVDWRARALSAETSVSAALVSSTVLLVKAREALEGASGWFLLFGEAGVNYSDSCVVSARALEVPDATEALAEVMAWAVDMDPPTDDVMEHGRMAARRWLKVHGL